MWYYLGMASIIGKKQGNQTHETAETDDAHHLGDHGGRIGGQL